MWAAIQYNNTKSFFNFMVWQNDNSELLKNSFNIKDFSDIQALTLEKQLSIIMKFFKTHNLTCMLQNDLTLKKDDIIIYQIDPDKNTDAEIVKFIAAGFIFINNTLISHKYENSI